MYKTSHAWGEKLRPILEASWTLDIEWTITMKAIGAFLVTLLVAACSAQADKTYEG